MSYQRTSGTYHSTTMGPVSNFTQGAEFTASVMSALENAGWTIQQDLVGKISVGVLAIADGVIITIRGTQFVFWWEPNDPPGFGVPVQIEQTDSLAVIVSKFGSAVQDSFGSEYSTTLDGNTITIEGFSSDMNGELCSIFPTGFGIWDGSTGVAGEGYIHNGGAMFNSAPLGEDEGTLDVAIRFLSLDSGKRISIRPISTLNTSTDEDYFNGLGLDLGSFRFIGSDLQFAIFGDFTGAGSLVFVTNLVPMSDTIDRVHFACGPLRTNVGPDGGSRTSFAGALGHYWAAIYNVDNTGEAYVGNSPRTDLTDPNFCYPGYARGLNPLDKLPNKIGSNNLAIQNDLLNLLAFEPFIAFSPSDPTLSSTPSVIMGQLWDALIYSTSSDPDVEGTLEDNLHEDEGIVLIGQLGTSSQSAGSLMVRT
jgi:hypothetical protein